MSESVEKVLVGVDMRWMASAGAVMRWKAWERGGKLGMVAVCLKRVRLARETRSMSAAGMVT